YLFPAGDYRVGRHRTEPLSTRTPGAVRNALFVDCDRLTIHGYDARILLDGRFHRPSGRYADGTPRAANVATFTPFDILRCRNVTIAGLEIDGGVRDMTRDAGVTEAFAFLVALNGCSNVLLQDLDLHHCQTDAIVLADGTMRGERAPGRACRDITLNNVKCLHNARGGLAALQVYGLLASDCEFSGNGFTGDYGAHAPGFGVDIEPDNGLPAEVDMKTGNVAFVRCNFYDNYTAIAAAYVSRFQGYCRFIDCNTRNRNNGPNHIILSWPGEGMFVQGGDHDAGAGCIYLSWPEQIGSKVTLRGMTIRSSHPFGLMHGADGSLATVEDCSIIGTHETVNPSHFLRFAADPSGGRKNRFARNRVFVPAAAKDLSTRFHVQPHFHHTDLAENIYTTDLSVRGQFFVRAINPDNCRVINERFRGSFPGPHDTFQPTVSGGFDTNRSYSYP
ncbi:MAG: right-handed parallel beta-helix repeat-containing protein, partial [Allosphingosinicella sp.]